MYSAFVVVKKLLVLCNECHKKNEQDFSFAYFFSFIYFTVKSCHIYLSQFWYCVFNPLPLYLHRRLVPVTPVCSLLFTFHCSRIRGCRSAHHQLHCYQIICCFTRMYVFLTREPPLWINHMNVAFCVLYNMIHAVAHKFGSVLLDLATWMKAVLMNFWRLGGVLIQKTCLSSMLGMLLCICCNTRRVCVMVGI